MLVFPSQEFRDVSICRTWRGGRVRVAAGRYRCWWPNYWLTLLGMMRSGSSVPCEGSYNDRQDTDRRDRTDQARHGTSRYWTSLENPGGGHRGFVETPLSRYGVFGGLNRSGPDDLAGRLRLEHRRLLGERIDALARLRGRLLDHDELCKSRHHERTGLLKFLVANRGDRVDDALDVLASDFARMPLDDALNERRFRHCVSHLLSPCQRDALRETGTKPPLRVATMER